MQQELTPDQSLNIIQEMIQQAKSSLNKFSPYFLIWGVVLLIASIMEFFMRQQGMELFWIGWPVAGVVGGLLAGIYGSKNSNKDASTFSDRLNSTLWGGFIVTLILTLLVAIRSHVDPNPFIMLLTGLPTFVTGALLRFAPLKWGGIAFWVLGALAFYVGPEYSALIFSISILVGYLLPGLMLQRNENGVRTP